jgi:hypothetical protein
MVVYHECSHLWTYNLIILLCVGSFTIFPPLFPAISPLIEGAGADGNGGDDVCCGCWPIPVTLTLWYFRKLACVLFVSDLGKQLYLAVILFCPNLTIP